MAVLASPTPTDRQAFAAYAEAKKRERQLLDTKHNLEEGTKALQQMITQMMLNQGVTSSDPVMVAIANVCLNKKKEIEEIVRSSSRGHRCIQGYPFRTRNWHLLPTSTKRA